MTNVLIGFGIILALAEESWMRLQAFQRVLGMQTGSVESGHLYNSSERSKPCTF